MRGAAGLRARWSRRRGWAAVAASSMVAALWVMVPLPQAAAAPTNTLTLQVVSARTEPRAFQGAGVTAGDPVDGFKFIINEDNVGDTSVRDAVGPCSPSYVPAPGEPAYPQSCPWTSINAAPDASPIIAEGDQDTVAGGLDLPPGSYLISVLADGYKIDGAHFSIPLPDANPVVVGLQPTPLPDSTVKGMVFADMAPTNGALDNDEQGLAGFQGHLNDMLGEVTTDVYGNPLCTTYVGEDPVTHEIPLSALDADMLPVVDQVGGKCFSDASGVVTYPHMGTNRYTQSVTPPDGTDWVQTTTLEGNHDWDTWVMEGSTGFDTEFTVGGEPVPDAAVRLRQAHPNGLPVSNSPSITGEIKGQVMRVLHYVPPKGGIFDLYNGFTGSKVAAPDQRRLALAHRSQQRRPGRVGRPGGHGRHLRHHATCRDGDYQLTWWDEAQNNLLSLQNVTVATVELEDLGMVADERLVDRVLRLRLQRQEPQRQEGRRRERHPQLHPDDAQARQLPDGPRPDHGRHRRQRATTASRAPTRWASSATR